jgi:hypothetical protein
MLDNDRAEIGDEESHVRFSCLSDASIILPPKGEAATRGRASGRDEQGLPMSVRAFCLGVLSFTSPPIR